jgi:hypothetical protein
MFFRMIEKRIRALEAKLESRACNCRKERLTLYHSSADLENILSIGCPVHVFLFVREVSWAPASMPLNIEDRSLCCCPPSATREWLEGKRGPLTEEEQAQECATWEQALSEDPTEQMRVEGLLKKYYKLKRSHNEIMRR